MSSGTRKAPPPILSGGSGGSGAAPPSPLSKLLRSPLFKALEPNVTEAIARADRATLDEVAALLVSWEPHKARALAALILFKTFGTELRPPSQDVFAWFLIADQGKLADFARDLVAADAFAARALFSALAAEIEAHAEARGLRGNTERPTNARS